MYLTKDDKIAIVYGDVKYTYTHTLERVNQFASLIPDDTEKVLIYSENRPEWIFAFYAGWMKNAIIVPVDFMATPDEVAYIINDCKPTVLFSSEDKLPDLQKALQQVKHETKLYNFDEVELKATKEIKDLPEFAEDSTAVIMYTSGTTGDPKGVMLSYKNLFMNVEAVSVGVPIFNKNENVMILLPLHHILPLMGTMIAPLFSHGTVAICPTMKSEDIIKTLGDNQISIIIGVPRLYKLIYKGIKDKINQRAVAKLLFKLAAALKSKKFSKKIFKSVHEKFGGNLKYMVSGGAALDPEVGNGFVTLGFNVLDGYGLTETAPMITFPRPDHVKMGAVGQALPGCTIRFDEGEIVVSGKNVMKGYYNRPKETADVLQDGWLHTGDIGYADETGHVFITGRKKEIIVLPNGKNVNPVEIEQKVENMSDFVQEIGVFLKDDILQAVIYPNMAKIRERGAKDMIELFRWEIIDAYNQSVSPYKKIMKFHLVDEELPRTRLSKLKRFLLPDLIDQDVKIEKIEHPEFEEYKIIKDFIESQTEKDIAPDDHLEIDIALDSLDKVNLLVFLKSTFGVDLSEESLKNHQTVRKLSEYIQDKKQKLSVELPNWSAILKEKVNLKLPKTSFTMNWFRRMGKAIFKMYFRLTGEGLENIPESPYILAPNHQSFFDGMFVAVFLDKQQITRTYFYAKKKHVRRAWVRYLASRNNVIVMDIEHDVKESIQKLAEVLKQGKNTIIFPEGTRSQDGSLGVYKKTFAILAKELDVPVVPVSITGAIKALPRGKHFPRPFKKIHVNFLQPVYPKDHTYESLTELVYERTKENMSE